MTINRASVSDLLTNFERVLLQSSLEAGESFDRAKWRLLNNLSDPPRLILPRWYDIQWLTGIWQSNYPIIRNTTKAPFGWAWDRADDRDMVRLVPIWILYPRRAWTAARWHVYVFLIRAGFLVGPEGGYFVEFRLSWRFWRSQRVLLGPVNAWQRICYALLRADARYIRDVPRWT